MILEGIVTTLDDAGVLNVAPMGVGSDDPIVAGVSEAEKQQNRRIAFRVSEIPAGSGQSNR